MPIVLHLQEKSFKSEGVSIEKWHHKHVIGLNGTNLQVITSQFGVHVHIPTAEDCSDTITVTGTQDKLSEGRSQS